VLQKIYRPIIKSLGEGLGKWPSGGTNKWKDNIKMNLGDGL
jgi:hypothetical protein